MIGVDRETRLNGLQSRRRSLTSAITASGSANAGIQNTVRKKFHADSINGRKITDADGKAVAGAGAGS